jgi:hypothetical protein
MTQSAPARRPRPDRVKAVAEAEFLGARQRFGGAARDGDMAGEVAARAASAIEPPIRPMPIRASAGTAARSWLRPAAGIRRARDDASFASSVPTVMRSAFGRP